MALDAADRRRAVGERRDSSPAPRQDVARVHAKRPVGEVAAAGEVLEHRVDAVVVARDRVFAGDVPGDVVRQHVADRGVVLARIERRLRCVQAGEHGFGSRASTQINVRTPASRSSRRRLVSSPPPNPTSEPSAPMTRWHGRMIAIGFAPLAAPTARARSGRPMRVGLLAVAARLAVRDLGERLPAGQLELGPGRREREVELLARPGEVLVQLPGRPAQQRRRRVARARARRTTAAPARRRARSASAGRWGS